MDQLEQIAKKAGEFAESMHKTGLEYGRVNALNEVILTLLTGSYETGLDALNAVIALRDGMTSEQYEAEAKADNLTGGAV